MRRLKVAQRIISRNVKLDIGCGLVPRGDINLDLRPVPKNETKNFIRADAEHLPFKSKVFSVSYSAHTIEHLEQPTNLIREMQRVTNGTIHIITPLYASYDYRAIFMARTHKHWFWPSWFEKYGFKVNLRIFAMRPKVLGRTFPVPLPFFEIQAIKIVRDEANCDECKTE